ncbi:MAG: hypothetical protein II458_05425, partial [Oscillospiraceae bacterium]|nr:hypothetical protein [Oscillospiraceae bacterium]
NHPEKRKRLCNKIAPPQENGTAGSKHREGAVFEAAVSGAARCSKDLKGDLLWHYSTQKK